MTTDLEVQKRVQELEQLVKRLAKALQESSEQQAEMIGILRDHTQLIKEHQEFLKAANERLEDLEAIVTATEDVSAWTRVMERTT